MTEKSFIAGAAEPVIRLRDGKRKFIDSTACTAYISAMAKKNQQPYRLPKTAAVSGKINEKSFGGMTYFEIEGAKEGSEVLYLHGGSYFAPPNMFHWDMLLKISEKSGARILVPLYPRAPIHTCSAAYQLLDDFCREMFWQNDDKKTVFMGDSAGGGLALGLTQQLYAGFGHTPDNLILLSPWLDISMENEEMAEYEESDPMLGIYGLKRMGKLWAGSVDDHDPRVSPIYGSYDGLKDVTVFVGTHEIFYPEAVRFAKKLDEQGVSNRLIVGEEMNHVWVCYPMREGREAIGEICEILEKEEIPYDQ